VRDGAEDGRQDAQNHQRIPETQRSLVHADGLRSLRRGRTERKKPMTPNPKLAMVRVVRIQTRVVRARASCTRMLAIAGRLTARLSEFSMALE
jgi:hypothetical protein